MSSHRKSVNQWTLAACTVAVAAAVGTNPAELRASEVQAIDQLQRYCVRSWQNAGISRQDWSDCTQETLAGLMDRISRTRLATAVGNRESDERRELNRSVWRTIQRWRRRPRPAALEEASVATSQAQEEAWQEVCQLASQHLTERQQKILSMTRDGWKTKEIAGELDLTPARVSDEKYKAIRKLQSLVG